MGEKWKQWQVLFSGLQNHCRQWLQPRNQKMFASWKKSSDKPRQHIKKQRHHFARTGPYCESYCFPSSHVRIWELGLKEGWALKNWSFVIVIFEKSLESHLDCKKIKPVNLKGNQPWIFIRKTVAEIEAPILWPPDVFSIRKRPWCWERLKAKGEGGGRGWEGWIVSLTRCTWVWAISAR